MNFVQTGKWEFGNQIDEKPKQEQTEDISKQGIRFCKTLAKKEFDFAGHFF